jgi:hypothetical protein
MPYLRIVYLCTDDSSLGRGDVYYLQPEIDPTLEQAAFVEIATASTYLSEILKVRT